MCTNTNIRLVAWWSKKGLEVYAHNPTDTEVACTLSTNSAFKGLAVAGKAVSIPAGASVHLSLLASG